MSAYMKICSAFEKLSLHQRSNFKTQFLFLQSATPQVEFNRGRRRSSHPPNWFVAKKNKSLFYENKELLPENKDFLQEVIRDSYHKQLDSPLRDEPWERHPWTFKTKRTGVLAIKIGAIPQWKKDGTKFFTTMLQVVDNHVIKFSPPEVFQTNIGFKPHWKQYGSVVVGALSAEPLVFTKDYCSIFKEAGVPPKRKLTRFLVTPDAAIQPGTPLFATHFKVGDYVDVQAKTIGHGFQGVVKRWGFKGGPATHGSTKFHRRTGSIGSGRQGARVKKGKKMPGHMGMDWRHLRGLKIWRINTKYNVIYVNGPMTPGPMHCYVRVFDTALKHRRREMLEHPPYNPTFYQDQDADGELPEEILHKDLYQLDEPSIIYEEAKS